MAGKAGVPMMRNISVIAVIALVVLGVVFLPVDVEYRFSVSGKVVPVREWALYRSRNDGIETALRDNLRGGVTQYTVNRFAGGDAARLTLEERLGASAPIVAGDTLAAIFSSEIAREYAALGGQLAMAVASLDLYATGEKVPVVEEERMRMAQAEELARQQLLELQRLRRLQSENLISEQELELAESQQRVLETGVEVARARYESVRSGAKPEQIELTRAEVRSLQEEIGTITEKLRLSTITSPISGRVARSFSSDTLLVAYDTTAFMVMMAVPLARSHFLAPGDTVRISSRGGLQEIAAVVRQLDDEVHSVRGEESVLVTAVVDLPPRWLLPGASVACRVEAGKVRLSDYLRLLMSTSA